MDKSRRQRPCLDRACKQSSLGGIVENERGLKGVDPLALDPKLWRKLPTELAYQVLSFLPVDRLMDTLRQVNRKWENRLRCCTFSQMFGHGKNLDSSYGFMTRPTRLASTFVAFEHESKQWREFPKKLQREMKLARLIHGGNDGLVLCEPRRIRQNWDSNEGSSSLDCLEIGVWNPLLQVLKWLPNHPTLNHPTINNHSTFNRRSWTEVCKTHRMVMVDEPSRSYKVFVDYICSRSSRWVFSIYSSTTGSWSDCKLMPSFTTFKFPRLSIACDRYICFDGYGNNTQHSMICREDYVSCYDVKRDSWNKVFLSKILADVDCTLESERVDSTHIESFAILRGLLYMVIHIASISVYRGSPFFLLPRPERFPLPLSEKFLLVSLDLSTIGAATVEPIVKLETVIPVKTLLQRGTLFRCSFNLYTYTMQGKGYVCVRTSSFGHFRHFDVSSGDWLDPDKFPQLGARNWEDSGDCIPFKPSLVVP